MKKPCVTLPPCCYTFSPVFKENNFKGIKRSRGIMGSQLERESEIKVTGVLNLYIQTLDVYKIYVGWLIFELVQ
jgi:hypothetical protein